MPSSPSPSARDRRHRRGRPRQPGMNLASSLRFSSSTSRARSECLPPRLEQDDRGGRARYRRCPPGWDASAGARGRQLIPSASNRLGEGNRRRRIAKAAQDRFLGDLPAGSSQVLGGDREWGKRDDGVAKGAGRRHRARGPRASPGGPSPPGPRRCRRGRSPIMKPPLTNVAHRRHSPDSAQHRRASRSSAAAPRESARLEELEVGEGRRAAERVAGVGVAVVEGSLLLGRRRGRHRRLVGRQRRRQRQIAAGQPLGEAEKIGRDVFLLAGEHRPGAAEADRHLVGDQQHVVLRVTSRTRADSRRGRRSSRPPPAPAARRPPPPARRRAAAQASRSRSRGIARARAGVGGRNKQRADRWVEAGDAADRDVAEGVAVIGARGREVGAPGVWSRVAARTGTPFSGRPRRRSRRRRSRRRGSGPAAPARPGAQPAGGAGVGQAEQGAVGDAVELFADGRRRFPARDGRGRCTRATRRRRCSGGRRYR